MFDVPEVAGQLDADLFFREAFLLELVSPTCHLLLVTLGDGHPFMHEGIAAQPYPHPYGSHLVVTVDHGPVVTSQDHDTDVPDTTEKHLILVDHQDIIDEPVIMVGMSLCLNNNNIFDSICK